MVQENTRTADTTFSDLVRSTLSIEQFEELKELLGSPHMRTKLLNNPAVASNDQLLLFAELLGLSAWVLYTKYGMGKDTVTEREAALHCRVHLIKD